MMPSVFTTAPSVHREPDRDIAVTRPEPATVTRGSVGGVPTHLGRPEVTETVS